MTSRLALVGAGDWATRHHLPAILADPRGELAVVIEPNPDRRRQIEGEFGVVTCPSIDEALADHDVHGAVVATPHSTHAPLVTRLVRAGVAVLVEKPLALRSADALELVELVAATGVPVMVGYTAQFSRAASAARDWVNQEIGSLRQVVIEFSSRAGARYASTRADDESSAYSAINGGGQATTQLSHAFAAVAHTTGLAFTEVAAFTADRGTPVDVDDVVAFRLGDGITGAAASTGSLPSGLPMRHRVRYLGEHGIVEHDLLWSTAHLVTSDGTEREIRPGHLDPAYPAAAPVGAFLGLLDGSGHNPSPVWPAAVAVAGIEAVLRSAASGRAETVDTIPR